MLALQTREEARYGGRANGGSRGEGSGARAPAWAEVEIKGAGSRQRRCPGGRCAVRASPGVPAKRGGRDPPAQLGTRACLP